MGYGGSKAHFGGFYETINDRLHDDASAMVAQGRLMAHPVSGRSSEAFTRRRPQWRSLAPSLPSFRAWRQRISTSRGGRQRSSLRCAQGHCSGTRILTKPSMIAESGRQPGSRATIRLYWDGSLTVYEKTFRRKSCDEHGYRPLFEGRLSSASYHGFSVNGLASLTTSPGRLLAIWTN